MSDHSADVLDTAAELQEQMNADGLARVREQLVQQHPDFNGRDCVDCSDPLPAVRLAYKRIRCTECQTNLEDRQRRAGRR